MDYLTSRGFSRETIDKWQLGYVLDPLPGHERFRRRLAIPYLTPTGVVHMKFRCLQDHDCKAYEREVKDRTGNEDFMHVKYDYEKGTTTHPYGVLAFQVDSPFICVTEGELDAIAADLAGLPAVAIPGNNNWKPHYQYCFEGYDEVIVLEDGDKAGKKLGLNVLRDVHNGRVLQMPSGSDVNSFLIEHGAQALRERVGADG